jgi:hypothetical protein
MISERGIQLGEIERESVVRIIRGIRKRSACSTLVQQPSSVYEDI